MADSQVVRIDSNTSSPNSPGAGSAITEAFSSSANLSLEYCEDFQGSRAALTCMHVDGFQVLLGTLKGVLVKLDILSRRFASMKVSSSMVTQVAIEGLVGFALAADESLAVVDLRSMAVLQRISLRNESRLHEKTKGFALHQHSVYCFGSSLQCFAREADSEACYQASRIKRLIAWRKARLFNEKLPAVCRGRVAIVLRHPEGWILLTDCNEVALVSRGSLKVLVSLLLKVSASTKVRRACISADGKLLAAITDDEVVLFNLFTQHRLQTIAHQQVCSISFLDERNEFQLALGMETGLIRLLQRERVRVLECHRSPVATLALQERYLLSASEDGVVAIWALPFNLLKHEVRMPAPLELCGSLLSDANGQMYCFPESLHRLADELRPLPLPACDTACLAEGQIAAIADRALVLFQADGKMHKTFECPLWSCFQGLPPSKRRTGSEHPKEEEDRARLSLRVGAAVPQSRKPLPGWEDRAGNEQSELEAKYITCEAGKILVFLADGHLIQWVIASKTALKPVKLFD